MSRTRAIIIRQVARYGFFARTFGKVVREDGLLSALRTRRQLWAMTVLFLG